MSSSSLKILHGRTATLAVIFDMDGLLLDTESLSLDSFITTASRYDVKVGLDDYQKMIGLKIGRAHV